MSKRNRILVDVGGHGSKLVEIAEALGYLVERGQYIGAGSVSKLMRAIATGELRVGGEGEGARPYCLAGGDQVGLGDGNWSNEEGAILEKEESGA